MLKTLREWAIVALLSLVAVEVAFQAAVRLGVVHFPLPSYSLANVAPFWRVISPDFGVWHPPNATHRHRKTCFDVTYTSNSHGMRDAEVSLTSPMSRVAVIGDSFVEGWGIDDGRRFTERLQASPRPSTSTSVCPGALAPPKPSCSTGRWPLVSTIRR